MWQRVAMCEKKHRDGYQLPRRERKGMGMLTESTNGVRQGGSWRCVKEAVASCLISSSDGLPSCSRSSKSSTGIAVRS